ncbi:50S ribosomal protein L18 [Dethiobacter alkaliphilus]|uniref:50S ribosomal protein L18 n=1 Tax=Dethiobacter alkaliphilus TaxID=427926 RepID=UPI00222636F7|nr:50S ribosomal protein L18 [Dethiobacter alkaliphilus]MCW3491099.1 50S ribosomal protein L18 [Dethiobacter alkaliphilus]
MITRQDKNVARKRRHFRVRKKIFGTPAIPRLNVFRSQKHIYAQLIDDEGGITLLSASSLDPSVREGKSTGATKEAARQVGVLVAKKAQEKGIKEVVFDRGGYLYHGRVKELAEGAREAGLEF